MKVKFLVRALVGGSAALVVSNSSAVSLFGSDSVAVTTRGDSLVRDTIFTGRSGKIRGPMLTYLRQRPFSEKVNGRIGQYLIGFWPGEKRRVTSVAYANPSGFFEVTRENQDTYVSEHFRLRDFLTKDQAATWPKYLVLRVDLVDKLELVIQDLQARGLDVRHMQVMSGFRTPHYNGPGEGGRSGMSRHMYGDAADVFVDNDRNGRMDDLNRDGRVDPATRASFSTRWSAWSAGIRSSSEASVCIAPIGARAVRARRRARLAGSLGTDRMTRPNRRRYKSARRRHPLLRADLATVAVAICAAIGVIQFYRPEARSVARPSGTSRTRWPNSVPRPETPSAGVGK